MTIGISAIITGILLAVNVGFAVKQPNGTTIGCAVGTGCMFLIVLSIYMKV